MAKIKYISLVLLSVVYCLLFLVKADAQAILNANGPGKTYERIDSILAPGYPAEETPDQCVSHPSFGRHIAEVWDSTLKKYVFEFYIHVPTTFPVVANTADNDRCINFDRQRVEIKTYESSPDSMKGFIGNTMTFKWMFRLPIGFQPSPNFTHIHQVKAVGGDEGDPIFTLTARYGTPDMLELNYVQDSSTSVNKLKSTKLSSFLGNWIEATEVVTVGANGSYSISLKKVSTGKILLSDTVANIQTIRPSNKFIRPKWGIYRSLLDPSYLRDDSLRLNSVFVYKGTVPDTPRHLSAIPLTSNKIYLTWTDTALRMNYFVLQRALSGTGNWATIDTLGSKIFSITDSGLLSSTNYCYRILAINPAGNSGYSNVVCATTPDMVPVTIKNFTGKMSDNVIHLKWDVENQINLLKYTIENSLDGVEFKSIGEVNNSSTSEYEFNWTNIPVASKFYFRLKMIDKNGCWKYSSILSINITEQPYITIFPNPSKGKVVVSINKLLPDTYLVITDSQGKFIKKFKIINSYTTLSNDRFAGGLYNIQLIQNNQLIKTYPLIINK